MIAGSGSLSPALNTYSYRATWVADPIVTLSGRPYNPSLIDTRISNSSRILARFSSSKTDLIAWRVSSAAIDSIIEPLRMHPKNIEEKERWMKKRKKSTALVVAAAGSLNNEDSGFSPSPYRI